ncbi:hypothetical protein HSX44_00620 [Wolbachia endosymbiont of Onchocerca gibsoni]|uniref:hypothetical protein n=1 Tax=Wolbachia endosymbiont of Onchocerca gibsoni TaxID=118986 RepID=UPI0023D85F96|nr:hypothetical protein [Wolbachia endosymbiont of Onchocerca gibsoni]MDF0607415.1 hypothetical protein [Wolbachia endosymbiont of Onchocerca gibsoni]
MQVSSRIRGRGTLEASAKDEVNVRGAKNNYKVRRCIGFLKQVTHYSLLGEKNIYCMCNTALYRFQL